MQFIDLHCDTLSRAYRSDERLPLLKNTLQVDIERLVKAECAAQFFAIFIPVERVPNHYDRCIELVDFFHDELERNSDRIAFAGDAADLEKNRADGKVSAFLTIEDSGIINCDVDALDHMHKRGVRLITLTWNYKNEVGSPNTTRDLSQEGLTPRGIEFMRECQRLGILVDVSHLSDAGFWDVAQNAKMPFTASHSNSRSIASCSRNLTDEMLRKLALCGGVAGLNFCGAFVKPREGDMHAPFADESCTMEDLARHATHMINIGGEDCLALGSDFDGISSWPQGLDDVSSMPLLFDVFKKGGLTEGQIEKIFYRNAYRLIGDSLKN